MNALTTILFIIGTLLVFALLVAATLVIATYIERKKEDKESKKNANWYYPTYSISSLHR